jgi:hypothetical protein
MVRRLPPGGRQDNQFRQSLWRRTSATVSFRGKSAFFNSGMKIAAGRPMRHINDDADAGIVTLNLVAALGQPGFPGEAV